jgi:hypothetical protein
MRERPDAETLLALAREHLADGGDVALAARAIAIAERERHGADATIDSCRTALAERYGDGSLEQLLARLAVEAGAVACDGHGPTRDAVYRLLWAITMARLYLVNPEYLARAGGQ